ncbi:MAG: fibronectin type III domain-containing protein, partial [Chlamydiales bacterium]
MKKILFLLLLISSGFFFFYRAETQPSALYLTWMHDPTSTMTIQWHSSEKNGEIFYQKEGENSWSKASGTAHAITQATLWWEKLFVHTIELEQLLPDTMYIFRLASLPKVYRFKTMPENGMKPMHFVVGGDVYENDTFLLKKMNARVAKMDPDFVVIGGDIAYACNHSVFLKGRYFEMRRWQTFFRQWKEQMVTSDGRLIPLVVILGNHDVPRHPVHPDRKKMLFYELFAFPEPSIPYRTLDFGRELSLLLLDTGYTYPIAGAQTQWLERALQNRRAQKQKMAVYHVGAYPSSTSPKSKRNREVRRHWSPLFERYGVSVAFEHHDHTFKRTHPIKGEKV